MNDSRIGTTVAAVALCAVIRAADARANAPLARLFCSWASFSREVEPEHDTHQEISRRCDPSLTSNPEFT